MIPFYRESTGLITASFTAVEAELISSLATQVAGLLGSVAARSDDPELAGTGIGGSTDRDDDPAIARLLPNAYTDDDDSSREFRQLTERGLASRKIDNAVALLHSLAPIAAATAGLASESSDDVEQQIELDDPAALAWMRSLTDIRLTIAARLGLVDDDDVIDEDDEQAVVLLDVYSWLGAVAESLVQAVDMDPHPADESGQ
jgi:hypothetical protein